MLNLARGNAELNKYLNFCICNFFPPLWHQCNPRFIHMQHPNKLYENSWQTLLSLFLHEYINFENIVICIIEGTYAQRRPKQIMCESV